jgi:formate hydrogenlyase subunit 3/multisubunit Na+/H+ antiporter MnhD subunit
MEISSLEGIGKKMPLTTLLFTIGTLSIIGLPPFVGFASKFMIIRAALAKGNLLFTILVGIVLLGTVIEGTYFFKVIQTMYFKGENKDIDTKESPVAGLIPMFIFAALIIFIGIYPSFITKVLNSAASELLDSLEYIRSVLG